VHHLSHTLHQPFPPKLEKQKLHLRSTICSPSLSIHLHTFKPANRSASSVTPFSRSQTFCQLLRFRSAHLQSPPFAFPGRDRILIFSVIVEAFGLLLLRRTLPRPHSHPAPLTFSLPLLVSEQLLQLVGVYLVSRNHPPLATNNTTVPTQTSRSALQDIIDAPQAVAKTSTSMHP
jgi:hypothetical protein